MGEPRDPLPKVIFLDLDDRITSRFHRKMDFLQILDHQKVFKMLVVDPVVHSLENLNSRYLTGLPVQPC